MPVFLETKETTLLEFNLDSFTSWAERKVKGYSANEIDHLATKVADLNSESQKKAVLERILNAIEDAKVKLAEAKEGNNKTKEALVRDHLEVLLRLKSYALAYDPIAKAEKHKQDDENDSNIGNDHRTVDLST